MSYSELGRHPSRGIGIPGIPIRIGGARERWGYHCAMASIEFAYRGAAAMPVPALVCRAAFLGSPRAFARTLSPAYIFANGWPVAC